MSTRSALLDALIPRTRQRVLAATILQSHRSWYVLELARHLQLRASSLQRELKELAHVGILKRERNGNRVYFHADLDCPIFQELAQLLTKTIGIAGAIEKALDCLSEKIDVAFIYGSIARASENSTSDIDLMIVGSAKLAEVAPILRGLENEVTRPINPTVYQRDEFIDRLQNGNHFLTNVVQEDEHRIYVKGGARELADLVASAKNQTTSHERAGTERSARRSRA